MRGSALASCALLFATSATRVGVYLDSDDEAAREMAAGAADAVVALGPARVEIVTRKAAPRWGGNSGDVAALLYTDGATALVAPGDPREAHAAVMVATRAKVAAIAVSGDPRLTRNGVPWIERAVPEDGELATLLLSNAPTRSEGSVALLIEAGGSGEATRDAVVAAAAALHVAIGPVVVAPLEGTVDRRLLEEALEKSGALLLCAGAPSVRAIAPAELPFCTRALLIQARVGAGQGQPVRVLFAATAAIAPGTGAPISLVRAGVRAAVVALASDRSGSAGGRSMLAPVTAVVWEWNEGMTPRLRRVAEPASAPVASRNASKQGGTP